MPLPFQVGITGGIGSGKSTVAEIFKCLKIPVYDADGRAKTLMNSDAKLKTQIEREFGSQSYDNSGNLDRRYLAKNVFGFPDRLEKLNALVHPCVAEDYRQWAQSQKSSSYVLKEAALLFESGSSKQLDKIILVTAPEDLRIKRVKSRDKRSEEEVRNIIHSQWSQEKSIVLADFVIKNDEETAIIPQVLQIHQEILKFIRVR
jgi:dephospho-CoA kinase